MSNTKEITKLEAVNKILDGLGIEKTKLGIIENWVWWRLYSSTEKEAFKIGKEMGISEDDIKKIRKNYHDGEPEELFENEDLDWAYCYTILGAIKVDNLTNDSYAVGNLLGAIIEINKLNYSSVSIALKMIFEGEEWLETLNDGITEGMLFLSREIPEEEIEE